MDARPCEGMSTEFFVPIRNQNSWQREMEREAKSVCARCPLQTKTACLVEDFAYFQRGGKVLGVRAGLNERERKALFLGERKRRKRLKAAAVASKVSAAKV